jgi:hypothetical protein
MTRRSHLAFIYLAAIFITQLTPARAAKSDWYKLTGVNEDFSVEFPARPTYQEEPVTSTGERLKTYNIAYGNNHFSLSYVDLRGRSATSRASASIRQEEYSRGYAKTIVDAGGQVLVRTALPDGGMEFVSKYPAGRAREMSYEQLRVYFQGARRYVLSCTSLSTSGIDQSLASRFFSSFQLYGTQKLNGVDKNARQVNSNSSAGNPSDAAWYKFTSLDGDFEVEFPDKPDYDTKAHPVTGTQMQVVSFTYGDYDVGVQSSDLVPPPNTSVEREQWLVGATEKFLRGSESRLIRQTRLSDGALQIESRRQLDGRTMFTRVRVYIRGSRGYVVSCSVFSQSLAALDEPIGARFFASFRFK